MIFCLVIARSEVCARAMKRRLPAELFPNPDDAPHLVIIEPGTRPHWTVTDEFNRVGDWIESKVGEGDLVRELRETIIITDAWSLTGLEVEQLNPIMRSAPSDGPAQLLAMLILSFPEVQWVSAITACGECEAIAHGRFLDSLYCEGHSLDHDGAPRAAIRLHQDGFVPLFDATGLRNIVRKNMKLQPASERDCRTIPIRKQQAVAIDEENSYAYFHAYTAYRFGFRGHVVTTSTMMETRLFGASSTVDFGLNFVTFEDLYLKFPEQKDNPEYSDLSKRDAACPKLKEASFRIIVTSGHRRPEDCKRLCAVRSYLRRLRNINGQNSRILFKPLAGIFDLREESGLREQLGKNRKRYYRGLAEDFEWPPDPDEKSLTGDPTPHSAPGRLLEIANRLIDRAERLLPNVRTVTDCVHGAVLVTDALELLADRTPTTALEAMALKHQFEVLAECQFYGVRSSLDVKARLSDIEREVEALACWFDPDSEDFTKWNAEASILSNLILVYRNHNRFDEEQRALARNRELHRKMWFRRPRNRWARPFQLVAWYIEFLLASLPRFLAAICVWIVGLALLFWLTGTHPAGVATSTLYMDAKISLLGAWESFFGIQAPPNELGTFNNGVILVAIIGGFVHLGVFISHLYSVVSRR